MFFWSKWSDLVKPTDPENVLCKLLYVFYKIKFFQTLSFNKVQKRKFNEQSGKTFFEYF
jgi:hypothetical protein